MQDSFSRAAGGAAEGVSTQNASAKLFVEYVPHTLQQSSGHSPNASKWSSTLSQKEKKHKKASIFLVFWNDNLFLH